MGWMWDLQAPETSVCLVTYSDSASRASATLETFKPSAFLSLIQEKRTAGGKRKEAEPGRRRDEGRGGAGPNCLLQSVGEAEVPLLCGSLGVVSPQNSYARSQLGRR